MHALMQRPCPHQQQHHHQSHQRTPPGMSQRSPQLPASARPTLLPAPALAGTRIRTSRRRNGVSARAYSDGLGPDSVAHPPQRVFMFDPSNPDSVQEMTVQPHNDIAAAEELLLAAEEEAAALQQQHGITSVNSQAGNNIGGGSSSGNNGRVMRTPIPLRAVSPMPARGTTPLGQRLASPLPQRTGGLATINRAGPLSNGGSNGASNGSNSSDSTALTAKSNEMQKQLVAQLEKEQTQVAHLAQYESMYREWRIKAERLDSDINSLQRLVAEKDAELSHGYRLLEASAAERSRLRHSYQAAQEQAKKLQMQLNEVQLLGAGSPQGPAGLLGAAGSSNGGNGKAPSNGNGAAAAAAALPSNMQAMIEELTSLAQGLAVEMSDEVRTISKSPGRSPSV